MPRRNESKHVSEHHGSRDTPIVPTTIVAKSLLFVAIPRERENNRTRGTTIRSSLLSFTNIFLSCDNNGLECGLFLSSFSTKPFKRSRLPARSPKISSPFEFSYSVNSRSSPISRFCFLLSQIVDLPIPRSPYGITLSFTIFQTLDYFAFRW